MPCRYQRCGAVRMVYGTWLCAADRMRKADETYFPVTAVAKTRESNRCVVSPDHALTRPRFFNVPVNAITIGAALLASAMMNPIA